MSTLKVDAIRHNSATSDAITTAADGTCTARITGMTGGGGLSHRNLIINGAMLISQRGSSQASITSSGYYNIDRFRTALNTGTVTTSQSTDVPTGEGFSKSFKVDVTTANTSLSGTNFLHVQQSIEGQNLQMLSYGTSGAKTITLSFFVKSNKTGIYCISLEKTDNTRYDYTAEYTISSANTWEKKTITIVPDSNIQASGGAIDNDNGKGFNLKFVLAAGGDRDNGANNTWNSSTPAHSTSNQVNFLDSTSNEWYVTGVQLEVGDTATSFEHRSYGIEYDLCRRYYERWYGGSSFHSFLIGMAYQTTQGFGPFNFYPKRDAPTLEYSNLSHFDRLKSASSSVSSAVTNLKIDNTAPTFNSGYLYWNHDSMTGGQAIMFRITSTSGWIALSAEL